MFRSLLSQANRSAKKTQEYSELFFASLTDFTSLSVIISIIIFLVSLTLFASLTSNALINGDAAVYEQEIISRLDFSRITVHIAYNLLGALFTQILPGSNDYALNLMNCFFGAISIALIYLLSFRISSRHTTSIISSLFIATNYLFVINSLYAEVYVLQTFFILLSLHCWLSKKPILTGFTLALAILVTPSTLLALPCFIVLRPDRPSLLRLYGTVFVVLAIAIIPHRSDYFFGSRGLFNAARSPINVGSTIIKEGYEAVFGLFLCVPFILIGAIHVVKERRLATFGAFLVCLWAINFLFAERFSDVPTQLPLYALLYVIGALGVQTCTIESVRQTDEQRSKSMWALSASSLFMILLLSVALRIGRTPILIPLREISLLVPLTFAAINIAYTLIFVLSTKMARITGGNARSMIYGYLILFLIMNSYVSFTLVRTLSSDLVEYREATLKANEIANPNYLIVGDWSQGILFEHYVFHEFNTGIWVNTECLLTDLWGKSKHEESKTKWRNSLEAGREIFVLGNFPSLLLELQNAGYTIEPLGNIYRATAQDQHSSFPIIEISPDL